MTLKKESSFAERNVGTREANPVVIPIQFSLDEIKQHFVDSLNAIKKQYTVAD